MAEKLQLADEVAARENRTEEKTGRVEARDLTEYKTDLIWQNIDRSGLGNICAVCKDASVFDEYDKETADLVIADLPCSGLGVLGKKPDLKYRVQPEDLEELADLQRKILTCAQAIQGWRHIAVQHMYPKSRRKHGQCTLVLERIPTI